MFLISSQLILLMCCRCLFGVVNCADSEAYDVAFIKDGKWSFLVGSDSINSNNYNIFVYRFLFQINLCCDTQYDDNQHNDTQQKNNQQYYCGKHISNVVALYLKCLRAFFDYL